MHPLFGIPGYWKPHTRNWAAKGLTKSVIYPENLASLPHKPEAFE